MQHSLSGPFEWLAHGGALERRRALRRHVVRATVVPTEVVRVRRAGVRGGERTVTETVRREQIEVEGA